MRYILLLSLTLALAACGKRAAAPSAPASVEPPAFKIAEQQRKQLDEAKALEQQMQKAAEEKQKAIEEATR